MKFVDYTPFFNTIDINAKDKERFEKIQQRCKEFLESNPIVVIKRKLKI
jgi:hypothetical protein